MIDLLILVADKNIKFFLQGVLDKVHHISPVRPFKYRIYEHPHRDPGCRSRSHDFTRPLLDQFSYALIIFDKEGSGSTESVEVIEDEVKLNMGRSGWDGRSDVFVIEPEIERLVWIRSPHFNNAVSWNEFSDGTINGFLSDNGFKFDEDTLKPVRPKEALECLLRHNRIPRSSDLYYQISNRSSLSSCSDPILPRFLSRLESWFPKMDESDSNFDGAGQGKLF